MTKHAIHSSVITLAIMSLTTLALAQHVDANAILTAAPKIATSVEGVYAFPALPKGFNPLTASNTQLLTYGLPERPDQATDANGYALWERAMLALKIHATDVQARPYSSTNAILIGTPTVNIDGTTSAKSPNWRTLTISPSGTPAPPLPRSYHSGILQFRITPLATCRALRAPGSR
jgi:hypothetical protein